MPQWAINFDIRLDTHTESIIADLAKVDALSKVIHGIPLPPGVQDHIDRLNILRAVRGTTGIEGTEVSETEVDEIIRAAPTKRVLAETRKRAEQEVRNARDVMAFIAAVVEDSPDEPLNENLIRAIHELTTREIDYPNNEPGRYRTHAVVAGTYVPPRTGDEVREKMEKFVRWFNEDRPRGWHPVIKAMAAHFFLNSIHPFGDGNGRTARAVESFLLYQGGINARGFYSLSNYYYQRREEYIAMLDHVRFQTNDNLTPFIRFGLDGLVSEQEQVHKDILHEVTIIAFRDYARERLLSDGKLHTKPGARMFHFLLGLPEQPVLVAQLRKGGHELSTLYHGVTAKTLSRDLNYLESRELIKIEDGRISANIDVMRQFIPRGLENASIESKPPYVRSLDGAQESA